MSTSQPTSVPTSSRPSPIPNGTSSNDTAYTNGHQHNHATGTSSNAASSLPKKGKAKKQADPDDAAKAVAARLAQLESNAADEKDQEAEIGGFALFFLKYFQGHICEKRIFHVQTSIFDFNFNLVQTAHFDSILVFQINFRKTTKNNGIWEGFCAP